MDVLLTSVRSEYYFVVRSSTGVVLCSAEYGTGVLL